MAIDNSGISSLDAGAGEITYSGNEGPKSPQEEQQQMMMAQLEQEYEQYKIQQIEIDPSKVLSFEDWRSSIESPLKGGGIAGLRHGGRPGNWNGTTPEEGDIGLEEQIIHPGTLDEGNIGMPGQATTEFEHEGALTNEPTSLEQVVELAKQ